MFSFKNTLRLLDEFFFTPRPTEGIALFRILWCSMLFAYFLFDIGNIEYFYGPNAITSSATVKARLLFPHLNVFNMLGDDHEIVYLVMFIYGLALIGSIIGYHTRISLFIVVACMLSFHQRNIWLLGPSELLMRTMTILLLCSPAGHSLSVDALLGRTVDKFRRPREWSPWTLRLMQIQLASIYAGAFWLKVGNDDWFEGTAFYYATRLDGLKNYPIPYLLDSVPFLKMVNWGIPLLELALGLGIWFREFRKSLIVIGLLFHAAMDCFLSMPFLQISMGILLLNFYTPEEYLVFVTRMRCSLLVFLKRSPLKLPLKEKLLWAARSPKKAT